MNETKEQKIAELAKTLLAEGIAVDEDDARTRAQHVIAEADEETAVKVYDEHVEQANAITSEADNVEQEVQAIVSQVKSINDSELLISDALTDMKQAEQKAKEELRELSYKADQVEGKVDEMERTLDVVSTDVTKEKNKDELERAFGHARQRIQLLKEEIAKIEGEIAAAEGRIISLASVIEASMRSDQTQSKFHTPSYDIIKEEKPLKALANEHAAIVETEQKKPEPVIKDESYHAADKIVKKFSEKRLSAQELLEIAHEEEPEEEHKSTNHITRTFDYRKVHTKR